jgi:hypothetical protein
MFGRDTLTNMPWLSSKRVIILILLLILLGLAGWFYSQRIKPVQMAKYVPEAALGYLEINSVPQVLNQLTATTAWKELAPVYGLENKLDYAGTLGGLAQFAGALGGETTLLARAQVAVVVTALEVRGEQVKPRWALLVETHASQRDLQKVIGKRLPELARRAFGEATRIEGEHAGVPLVVYQAAGREEKQLLSAQIESEWLLANHPEALRACIETRLGRAASMTNNFYLQQARPAVERNGEVFGFITGDGVTRLLRFGAYLLAGGAVGTVGKAALAGAVGDVFTDFSSRATDGVAYGVSFEGGGVVDRYVMLMKPDLLENLRAALKLNQSAPQILQLIPASVQEVTLLNIENPGQSFGTLERVISARVGVGQSFLLRHFLTGLQEAFLGLRIDELAARAIGNEVASLNFSDDVETRIWLLQVRDRALVQQVMAKVLTAGGLSIEREQRGGAELWHSSAGSRGSAVFFDNYVGLGKRAQLVKLLDARRGPKLPKLVDAPQLTRASRPSQPGVTLSLSATGASSAEMMATLARSLGARGAEAMPEAVKQLPLAVSVMSFNQQGLYVESHAPLGSFPLFVTVMNGALGGDVR